MDVYMPFEDEYWSNKHYEFNEYEYDRRRISSLSSIAAHTNRPFDIVAFIGGEQFCINDWNDIDENVVDDDEDENTILAFVIDKKHNLLFSHKFFRFICWTYLIPTESNNIHQYKSMYSFPHF